MTNVGPLYFRIVEKTSPVTYKIRDQLTGTVRKTHAEHLRLAQIDQWEIPKPQNQRHRKALYVVPPESSTEPGTDTDSDPDDNLPLRTLIDKNRKERTSSSEEDSIPLMELGKRLKQKEREGYVSETDNFFENDAYSDNFDMDYDQNCTSDEKMSVDAVRKFKLKSRKQRKGKSNKNEIKKLLSTLSNIL